MSPKRVEMAEKTAIVLSGGGITGGMYELGALAALDDLIVGGKRTTDFDIFIGISAGSIIASILANGIPPKLMYRSVLGPSNNPLFMRREDIYSFPLKEYLSGAARFLLALPRIIKRIKREGDKVSLVRLFDALEGFVPAGFYTNSNLEKYMERVLSLPGNTNSFRELKKELYIIGVELDTGERWIFGDEGKDEIPISKAVRASTAIPAYFSPVKVGNRYFIDGASERSGHVDVAIKKGASLILVINPVVPIYNDRAVVAIPTPDGKCCSSIGEAGISRVMEQSFRINSRVKLSLGLSILKERHPEVDILLIEPGQLESTLFLYGSMNFSERIQILNYGYNSASVFFIENYETIKERFERHGYRISLNNLKLDKFLYFTTRMKSRKRFRLPY